MSVADIAATLLLSPLLLAQAMRVRKIALQLPEAAGPRTGIIGSGPVLRVLIIGDSSAAGVGAPTQEVALAGQLASTLGADHTVHWRLIAKTGATTASTLQDLHGKDLPQTDIVVVVLGVNDVTRGGPQAAWLRHHETLRSLLRERTDAQHLYIGQIPPLGGFPLLPNPLRWLLGRRALRFDAALRSALATESDTTHAPLPDILDVADMAEDGFHPGPVIYAAWAKEMARLIISDGPF